MKIGLEVHVALPTKSKLFCSCRTYVDEPNSSICPICMGMPGSKPKLNKAALKLGISVANVLHCAIPQKTGFVRKVYFYPDLPKGYQISQLYDPVGSGGYVEISKKRIRIRRVQLEEDPAKIIREDDYVLLDFNRAGTPLLEIVTEPDIESEEELREFYAELRSLLYYQGIDIDKEMKADLNISLSKNRVEVKNVTGIKNLVDAARYEIDRQGGMLSRGEEPPMETRSYVAEQHMTISSREKETDEEYGYIFEPDLTFYSTAVELQKPVYASKIAGEFASKYNASEQTIKELISNDRQALELLSASAGKYGMQGIIAALELVKKYNAAMDAKSFYKLVELVEAHVSISEGTIARIAKGEGIAAAKPVSEEAIVQAIKSLLAENPRMAESIAKNPKGINAIVGKVSKETGADPKFVFEIAKKITSQKDAKP